MSVTFDKKKAMATWQIVSLVVSVITTVLLIAYISNNFSNSGYYSSILECQKTFNEIKGRPTFFGDKLDKTTPKFTNLVSEMCPSKDFKVSSKGVGGAVDLISDCFRKSGPLANFWGANAEDEGVLLYCGKIVATDDIKDFGKRVRDELKKDDYKYLFDNGYETTNTNFYLLSNWGVPDELSEGNVYYVFYSSHIYSEKSLSDSFKTYISKFVGASGSWASIMNYYVADSSADTLGGVVLAKGIDSSDDAFGKLQIDIASQGAVIVPKKNYD